MWQLGVLSSWKGQQILPLTSGSPIKSASDGAVVSSAECCGSSIGACAVASVNLPAVDPGRCRLRFGSGTLPFGRKRGPSELLPRVLGVAPAPAEFQIDPHRHFERARLRSPAARPAPPCSRVVTEHSSASCICSSGTMPSRQHARIHSFV